MKCPRCQQDNPPSSKFCSECGIILGGAVSRAGSDAAAQVEIERLRRALGEALEQQIATSEILRVISSSPMAVQPIFDTIVRSASRLCGGEWAIVTRYDGELLHIAAQHNPRPGAADPTSSFFPHVPRRETSIPARALIDAAVVHISDIETEDLELSAREQYRRIGLRAVVAVPMVHEGRPIGVVAVSRGTPGPFSDRQIDLLRTFADQAVIAIENVRLFKELRESNDELTDALQQQGATGEILRVISQSPTDVQPVFDAIVESAVTLCDGLFGGLVRFDGELIYEVATHNYTPEALDVLRRILPARPSRSLAVGRAILDREVVHLPDVRLDPEYQVRELADAIGFRSGLFVPMLLDGVPVGAILVARAEPGPFPDSQIGLLKTFADQAVIAIENVRLFKELQSSNRDLMTALDQQTATSEVLRTIAHAKTDPQPVFDTILRSAVRLCHAAMAAVSLTDGRMLYLPANYGSSPEAMAAVRARFPRPLDMETATGTAILTRSVVHAPDVQETSVTEFTRQSGRVLGFRSLLSVPMLRQGEAMGAINVTRREPGPFSEAEVALLETFADQAVIAVENVRLFTELEGANRELSAASRHKSEFLANMSHELRTPLNAIIGFSELLSERLYGDLNEKQEEYLRDIHASGQHLLSLINDILDLSKIEAGRMELELTDFDLPTAIDNALTLVRERAGRRGIALHQAVHERLGQIRGDERKVKQVLLNLLSNAVKFTPDGGRIEVRAISLNGAVEVSVSDTGVGIAFEDQEAIFEEFRQVGTAAKKVEGTGLGLALSRKFVELHGGRIRVESEPGRGSTFTFTLPVA